MGVRLLRGLGRALGWNVAVGTVFALVASVVIAIDSPEIAAIALMAGPMFGAAYGFGAGLVHFAVQVPLLAWNPRHVRAGTRVLATLVSASLAVYIVYSGSDEGYRLVILATYMPYVLATPLLAVPRQTDASTDAAVSAARRNGASTASRNDGSAPDISRATSE